MTSKLRNALLALALMSASPALAQEQTMAQGIAEVLQPQIPRQYGENVVLVAANAQRNLLVLTIEFRNNASLPQEQLAHIFAGGFCQEPGMDQFFRDGLRIRVDVRTARGVRQGLVVDRCP